MLCVKPVFVSWKSGVLNQKTEAVLTSAERANGRKVGGWEWSWVIIEEKQEHRRTLGWNLLLVYTISFPLEQSPKPSVVFHILYGSCSLI